MPPGSGPGRKRGRLSRSGDFDRVYREGHSKGNRFFVMYAFPRPAEEDAEELRLGVSVSRKVGGAVERNLGQARRQGGLLGPRATPRPGMTS